ncbi:hypothetical protein HGM15179_006083 [Zosterops borbonicus]|uniref:Uncharacterized protein n=1 Tax=Zosterops borbonicus TaxID=364589 RepID=A0A8K1LP80_9PASS|nr:hypothetical protein HGM15179_006083 [Zosterops borbonicus]
MVKLLHLLCLSDSDWCLDKIVEIDDDLFTVMVLLGTQTCLQLRVSGGPYDTRYSSAWLMKVQISSTPWHDMQTEINIRLACEIDIRKELSRNGTTGLDKIREDHRKEIRTIQPALDTWTA